MRPRSNVSMWLLPVMIVLGGCGKGENLLRAKGQVLKHGEAFIPAENQNLQVCFIPIADDGSPPRNWYAAEVDQKSGTFYAAGGEKKGMPAGKYRVMVELKEKRKDLLAGKFDSLNSPFIFEVNDKSAPMIVEIE